MTPGFPQSSLAPMPGALHSNCRAHTCTPPRGSWSLRQAPGLPHGGVSCAGLHILDRGGQDSEILERENHQAATGSEQLALPPAFSRPLPGLTCLIHLINLISQLMKLIAWRFVNIQGTPQKVNIGNGQDQSLGDGALILQPVGHACLEEQ